MAREEGEAGAEPKGIGRDRKLALAIGCLMLVLAAAAAALLSSPSSPGDNGPSTGSTHPDVGFTHPNVDPSNTRSVGGPIQGTTVSSLGVAWTLPLTGAETQYGAYWSSPVIADGVVYSQDSASNVQAIDLQTGDVTWEARYESPASGPNGVVVGKDRVYGASATSAFALDRKTGEEIWSVALTRSGFEGIEMAPGYHDGLVYVSTSPVAYRGGEVGILWALDATTGRKVWSFDTVPKSLWGNPTINFGGGLSQTPAFDNEGSMYFGVNNPGPIAGTERQPWGSSRPGPNLYTGSIVKLDARTGKLEWYYQLTPHLLCDWDLQGPPILVEAGGRDLVVAGGKSGIVIALDQSSGKLVWARPVGIHNGHDDDGSQAMKGDYANLKLPMTVYPGAAGGLAAPASTDGSTIFASVVNQSATLTAQQLGTPGASNTGELVAIDVKTGAIKWKHVFSTPPYGATSVVNDLVFATTYDGSMYAFESETGNVVWETLLPAGMTAGLGISGDTLLAPAGIEYEGEEPQMVAYRLG